MKEIYTRTISGILYIAILLGVLFFSPKAFLFLFAIFGIICLHELLRLLQLKSLIPYGVLVIFLYFFSYLQISMDATVVLLLVTIMVKLLLIKDLLIIHKIPLFEERKYILAIFYLISSIVFLTLIPEITGKYTPSLLMGIFILVWTNDTFAYLVGKNFGKHKLLVSISPKKTVEGFMGGIIFSCAFSYLIFIFTELMNPWIWLGLALIVSIFGTFGDLVQSKLKRQADVKDSGTLIPGHGGLFDRLDSVLFASSFVYAFLLITTHHVS